MDSHFALNADLQGLFFTDAEAGLASAGLILDYNFNENNHSPFMMAGVGYGWSVAESKAPDKLARNYASGFAGSCGGGVKMFRAYDVNLGLSMRYIYFFGDNTLGKTIST